MLALLERGRLMDVLLEMAGARVTYQRAGGPRVEAVRGVDFSLASGDSLGIVGESGSGKSTLARAVMGLQPLTEGVLRYEGRDVATFRGEERKAYRRAVQMVFQDAVGSLNPRMTVKQTLEEALLVHRIVSRDQVVSQVNGLLDLVGLPQRVLESYPRELSGGQCQRVSFARALAVKPRVLIADEPVSALDVSVQARILNLVRSLQKELGLTVILISHDLAVVRTICSHVAVMHCGLFVERGETVTVMDHPQDPYTKRLLSAVPDVNRALEKRARQENH